MGHLGGICKELENLLIPSCKENSDKKPKDDSYNGWNLGGVLEFEFKERTEVRRIGLLDVVRDNSTIDEDLSEFIGV